MSEERPSGSITAIVKPITDIAASVAAVIAYLQAIFELVDIPYSKTISLLTILGTSILVVNWRWRELNRKKGNALSKRQQYGGSAKPPRKSPLLERILDPIKQTSREHYLMPLMRRRVEAGLVLFITVFTFGWTGFHFSPVAAELTKNPSLTCDSTRSKDKLLIVVADLLETNPQPPLLISDKIYESLVSDQKGSLYNVCRLLQPIKLSTIALETAQKYKADILIWGRSDVIYEIHLEAPALVDPNRKLSELASAEAASVEFQFKEPKHIAYVTQFALSEILLLNGQTSEAQSYLADVLSSAKRDSLDRTHPQDIADGYFLLGLFYDPGFSPYPNFSPHPDEQNSVDAYKNAVDLNPNLFAARLNHGLILRDMGRVKDAMADFTFLIENNTPLMGSAYFFRGTERMNQGDYQGASEDFEKAIEFDPQGFYNYHLLGQVQLYAGEADAAKQTYTRIIPYLNEDTRRQVILELQEDAQAVPEIKSAVDEIIRALQAATLP